MPLLISCVKKCKVARLLLKTQYKWFSWFKRVNFSFGEKSLKGYPKALTSDTYVSTVRVQPIVMIWITQKMITDKLVLSQTL